MTVFSFSESVSKILNEMIDLMMVYIRKLMSWDNSTQARNLKPDRLQNIADLLMQYAIGHFTENGSNSSDSISNSRFLSPIIMSPDYVVDTEYRGISDRVS